LLDLRPVEDFRHTPLIPVSDKEMKKYKDEVEQRNRKGYYVEIKKDTIYFYTITFLALGTVFYTFLMVNESQMRIKEDLERTKTLRSKAARGTRGASSIGESEMQNTLTKKSIF
jgi:hypothetical protein